MYIEVGRVAQRCTTCEFLSSVCVVPIAFGIAFGIAFPLANHLKQSFIYKIFL
jgi:hypothetical protein